MWQLLNDAGAVVGRGELALNHFRRLEAPAPDGELAHIDHPVNDFTLRVPAIAGGTRLRILEEGGRQSVNGNSRIVAEFPLPAEVHPNRMAVPAEVEILFENGPRSNRINLVVFGDGFRESERAAFRLHANAAVQDFLATPPMAEYRSFFNAYAIFTPSLESGSDHPGRGEFRDTYFNSSYDSYGIFYLLTIPPNNHDPVYQNGQGKVFGLLAQLFPDFDIPLMVVNDAEYGGSGGAVPVASIEGSAGEIMVHELGHSFAGLGDEYTTPYPGYPEVEEPNTTRETRRAFIKWNAWIDASTPVPTPAIPTYANAVGLFEGAHYHSTGWYRPKLDCKMRNLGIPLCEVCAETLTLEMHERVSILQQTSPEETTIVAGPTHTDFQVEVLEPTRGAIALEWHVDGVLQPEKTELFRLTTATLTPGMHEVKVTARDSTDLVRTDPQSLLEESRVWNLTVTQQAGLKLITRSFSGNSFSFEVSRPVSNGTLEKSMDLERWTVIESNSYQPGIPIQIEMNPGEHAVFVRLRE